MKKPLINLTRTISSVLIFFLITFSFTTIIFAEGEESEAGHICSGTQCLSCTVGEDGCLPGVCTAFICEDGDEIPPLPPIIINLEQLEEPIGGNSLRVAGVGEANARIIITIDGQEKHEAAVSGDGSFDVTFNPGLTEDGEYDLAVFQVDQAENESDPSTTIIITVDATEPELELSNVPAETGFQRVLISGSTEEGAKVEIFKDGQKEGSSGADENGIFDLLLDLDDGENKFEIIATDKLGNSSSKDINIQFDSDSAVEITAVANGTDRLTITAPDEIIAIEIATEDMLLDRIELSDGEAEIDISQYSDLDDLLIYGLDTAGNQTEAIEIEQADTQNTALIVVGIIILLGVTVFIGYQIRNGKINVPGLSGSSQLDMELEKEVSNKDKDVLPREPRKEY